MKIEHREIEQLAELVCLRLTPEEIIRMSQDEARILDYVNHLRELNVEHIPLADDRRRATLRPDKPAVFERTGELLSAFPMKQGRYLKVPFVFKG